MTTATSNPPTLRRCRRIMQAHHLDCQGLKPQQIADQLVDHVHLLTKPQSDPAELR